MSFRSRLVDFSCGNDLTLFWRLFQCRARTHRRWWKLVLTFLVNRCAARHGGYIGFGARIDGIPSMPHGLHGVHISRYAHIGVGCRIYQNVTIGEVDGKAPSIGDHCLLGANACLVGDITVGSGARIGAGAVVAVDVPAGSTVVAQPPRLLQRGWNHDCSPWAGTGLDRA